MEFNQQHFMHSKQWMDWRQINQRPTIRHPDYHYNLHACLLGDEWVCDTKHYRERQRPAQSTHRYYWLITHKHCAGFFVADHVEFNQQHFVHRKQWMDWRQIDQRSTICHPDCHYNLHACLLGDEWICDTKHYRERKHRPICTNRRNGDGERGSSYSKIFRTGK
jgi:hypothetical protein